MSQTHSSDEDSDFKAVSSSNYQRIQDKVAKINYADGIAEGREHEFQSSFDQGYADGLRTGFELAKLSSFYDTLAKARDCADDFSKEIDTYQTLQLAKATDQTHFKYLENQTQSLQIVSEKQNAYLDDLLGQCAASLPTTTNLFSQGFIGF